MNQMYKEIINEMIQQQNHETIEEKIENTRSRNMRMAGIINDYLFHEYGYEIIITGGLSVEFYTDGQYTTQDIDLITVAENELNQILLNLGFHKIGKYWEHEKLEMILELVANIPYDGIFKQPTETISEDGFKILFNNVNDILMDRIRGFIHWNFQQYAKWIIQLIRYHRDELDFSYLEKNLDDQEQKVLSQFIDIADRKINNLTLGFYLKQLLDDQQIHYSENSNEEIHYVTINLDGDAKNELGKYFGILLSPFFAIMLYNEEEDELVVVDVNEHAKLLAELASNFGKPFIQIQNFMKEWIE